MFSSRFRRAHPLIANARMTQVELCQAGKRSELLQVGVGDPRAAEIHSDHVTARIALDRTSAFGDPRRGIGRSHHQQKSELHTNFRGGWAAPNRDPR